ncbi:MAG: hypothetical protein ACPGSD_17515 [Flavobacteriales bacterium]
MIHSNSLLDKVQEIVYRYSEDIKQSGENFNLFSLLRKEDDEVNKVES